MDALALLAIPLAVAVFAVFLHLLGVLPLVLGFLGLILMLLGALGVLSGLAMLALLLSFGGATGGEVQGWLALTIVGIGVAVAGRWFVELAGGFGSI